MGKEDGKSYVALPRLAFTDYVDNETIAQATQNRLRSDIDVFQ